MFGNQPQLGSILLAHGVITEEQLIRALDYQKERKCRLGEALIELELCSDREITRVLAQQLDLRFVDLLETPPSPRVLNMVSRDIAGRYGFVPVRQEGLRLLVAARNPLDIHVDEAVRAVTGLSAIVAAGVESQIQDVLRDYEKLRRQPERAPELRGCGEVGSSRCDPMIGAPPEDRPETVQQVNSLLAEGLRRGATEISFEPGGDSLLVRARVDGQVVCLGSFAGDTGCAMLERVRRMFHTRPWGPGSAGLHSYDFRFDGRHVLLRSLPLANGAGGAGGIRILNPERPVASLSDTGLTEPDLRRLLGWLGERQGLVIVAGPVYSGKRSTLYSALRHLRDAGARVVTVEEGISERVEGLLQLETTSEPDRPVLEVVRTALNHQPDVLAFTDISDRAVGETACRAALAGRLVLVRVHAPDAVGALAQLAALGIDPRLLAASLTGVIAQRLLPRNCDACLVPCLPPDGYGSATREHFAGSSDRLRSGVGCDRCHGRGTLGRTGVFELLRVNEDLRVLLSQGILPSEVRQHAGASGFRPMAQDAVAKALEGLVPPEPVAELLRDAATTAGLCAAPGSGWPDSSRPPAPAWIEAGFSPAPIAVPRPLNASEAGPPVRQRGESARP